MIKKPLIKIMVAAWLVLWVGGPGLIIPENPPGKPVFKIVKKGT